MTSVATSGLNDLGLALPQASAINARKQLGQDDFFKLMTTQMQNQDPFKPLDPTAFLAQIAQFSTVSGLESLNQSFAALSSSLQSNQALQAAGLVGRGVMVPGDELAMDGGSSGYAAVEVPSSGAVAIEVRDSSGAIVRTLDLGIQPAGLARFGWDGLDSQGQPVEPGLYSLSGRLQQGDSTQSLETFSIGQVSSVSMDASGLRLNLLGMSPVDFSQVRQIF